MFFYITDTTGQVGERSQTWQVAENESSQNEESKTLSDPEKTNEPNDKVQ